MQEGNPVTPQTSTTVDKGDSGYNKALRNRHLQMIAIGFLLAGPAGDKIIPYTTELGIILLWVAAVITMYTGYDYFRAGLKHVVDA